MKVKELIKKLQKLDQDNEIMIGHMFDKDYVAYFTSISQEIPISTEDSGDGNGTEMYSINTQDLQITQPL